MYTLTLHSPTLKELALQIQKFNDELNPVKIKDFKYKLTVESEDDNPAGMTFDNEPETEGHTSRGGDMTDDDWAKSDAEKPAPKAKAKPAPKKVATPVKAAPAKAFTVDEVRAACMASAAKRGRADTDAILQKIGGAKKVNLVDASKYGALMKALK